MPVLLTPAGNATGLSGTVTLTWQAVPGADQYKVSVSTPSHSNDIAWDSSYVGTSYVLSNLTSGTYIWRIKAKHAANPYQASAWTANTYFTVGLPVVVTPPVNTTTLLALVLQYPSKGASFQVPGANLSWLAVKGATFYKVTVATDVALANVVFQDNNVASLNRVAQNLAYNTTYYWSVQAATATTTGPAAAVHSFTTMPANPNAVTTHPRLLITQADLPKLQSWASPTNSVFVALQAGLNQAIAIYNTKFYPGGQPSANWPDDGTGIFPAYVSEAYAEFFAFWSLIDPVVVNRPIHAQRARNLLMYVIDHALPGAAAGVPFRDPLFMTKDRSRMHGENMPLTVDWIYNAKDANGNPILTTADKASIRTVFLRWSSEQLTAWNHPTPIGLANDKAITLTNRFVLNNYYSGHARTLTLMSLALDAADDAPLNPSLHYSALDNSLRSYLYNATGAWLYQQYAQYETPAVVAADYGVPAAGLGMASGGFSAESSLYGQSIGWVAQQMLALKTAGWADETVIGKQAKLLTSPYWTKMMDSYLLSMASVPKVIPPMAYLGPIYQTATYGDELRTWITPYLLDIAGPIGLIDMQLNNNQSRLDKIRWFARNAIEGGSANLTKRVTGNWGNFNNYATASIYYFMLLDPAGSNPADPRPAMPTFFFDPALTKIRARTDWSATATLFNWQCGWTAISHQEGDGNEFELFRKGEWLTKERTGYNNDGTGGTSEFHNTLGLQNTTPNNINWFEPPIVQRGGQWTNGQNAGDPTAITSVGNTYVYATGDATNLYNRPPQVVDIAHASRSIVWLKPDHVVVYDRATSLTTNRFKRFFLQFTAPPVISGKNMVVNTPGGQKVFLSNLLPAAAVLTTSVSETFNSVAQLEPTTNQLKIEDPANPQNIRFLNVIQGADGNAPADAAVLVQSTAGNAFEGAVVKTTAVLFPNVWGTPFTTTTYSIPSAVTTQLMTGLIPNAGYDVATVTNGPTATITITPGNQLKADAGGVLLISSAGGRLGVAEPAVTLSLAAAPNPASTLTTLYYTLPQTAPVSLEIFDLLGRPVAVLLDNEVQEPGDHQVIWPTKQLLPGTYVSRLTTGIQQVSLRIVLH